MAELLSLKVYSFNLNMIFLFKVPSFQKVDYRQIYFFCIYNTNLNDLRNSICLKKSQVSVGRISFWCNRKVVCHAVIPMMS